MGVAIGHFSDRAISRGFDVRWDIYGTKKDAKRHPKALQTSKSIDVK